MKCKPKSIGALHIALGGGALLDRAIERSQRPMKLIEAAPATVSSEVMQKRFARMRKKN